MKTKKYWLNGIFISTAIFVIFLILFFTIDLSQGSVGDWLILVTMMPFAFAAIFTQTYVIVGFILQFLLYVLIGFSSGYIYGKFRI
jgi:hypothetical protein